MENYESEQPNSRRLAREGTRYASMCPCGVCIPNIICNIGDGKLVYFDQSEAYCPKYPFSCQRASDIPLHGGDFEQFTSYASIQKKNRDSK